MKVNSLEQRFSRLLGIKKAKEQELNRTNGEYNKKIEDIQFYTQASEIVAIVMKEVQAKSKGSIERLSSDFLSTIYRRDIEFIFKESTWGNSPELTPFIIENGEEFCAASKEEEIAGGMYNAIGLPIRIIFLKFYGGNFLILDEPFKFLGALSERIFQILTNISKEYGIQIIMTTHDQTWITKAQKTFWVESGDNGPKIKEVEEQNYP